MLATLVVVGVLGAVIGSFLNVVVHRLPRGESLVSPGSRCPSCGASVAPYDNVPILSWVLLRGRCRRCGHHISVGYSLTELLTAAVFVAIAAVQGLTLDLILSLPFAAVLIAVARIDLEHRIVPNRILAPAAVWALLGGVLVRLDDVPELLASGAAAFLLLLLAALAYPAGMGMGDVKLAGVIGLYLGFAVAPALFVGFLAGALVGVAMMARQGVSARKAGVPFAPFLAVGGLLGILAGTQLVDLYVESFLL